MPVWQARYFTGADQDPFYTEEFEADTQGDAVDLAWERVVTNAPVGIQQGRAHTTYRPGMATHVSVISKMDLSRFRPL